MVLVRGVRRAVGVDAAAARRRRRSESQGSAVDANALTPERQDAIERTFQRKAGGCRTAGPTEYEKNHDRKLEGDVTVGFDITPAGAPANVRILKSSLNNRELESCVTKAVAGWSFPEGSATVPYMRTVHLGAQF